MNANAVINKLISAEFSLPVDGSRCVRNERMILQTELSRRNCNQSAQDFKQDKAERITKQIAESLRVMRMWEDHVKQYSVVPEMEESKFEQARRRGR